MGRPAGWLKGLTGRSEMISPEAPKTRRSVERQFWKAVANGVSSEDAAVAEGGRLRSELAGSGKVAACPPSRSRILAADICPSPSGRRSRCCGLRSTGFVKSRADWAVTPRPSPGSCAAMPRPEERGLSTGPRSRSERRNLWPGDRRKLSSWQARGYGTGCRSVWKAASGSPDGTVINGPVTAEWHGRN